MTTRRSPSQLRAPPYPPTLPLPFIQIEQSRFALTTAEVTSVSEWSVVLRLRVNVNLPFPPGVVVGEKGNSGGEARLGIELEGRAGGSHLYDMLWRLDKVTHLSTRSLSLLLPLAIGHRRRHTSTP